METLESSRVCRLCGQHSGISINIFDENENHIRKINAVLPIMVHEMDLLPKQMCHRCSYKLEEFHKFYVNCLKTDAALKNQLSWMRKSHGEDRREKIGVPMVHIENVKIKTEPLDYDMFELEPLVENIEYINSMGSVAFPADGIHDELTYATFSRCQCYCDKDQSRSRQTAAEFCRDYEESVSRCGGIANHSRKKTLKDTRLRPILRKTLLPSCLQNPLSRVNVAENARDRLATDLKGDVETRNRLHDKSGTVLENSTASKSTIVRNLRPRTNLVSYAPMKKKTSSVNPDISPSKSNVPTSTMTLALDFEPRLKERQIKEEQLEEFEGRTLRPRRNLVDYHGSKKRKFSEYRAEKCTVLKNIFPLCPAKKTTQSNQKLPSRKENASDILNYKVKREALDDLRDTTLNGTTSAAASRLASTTVVALPAKTEPPTIDVDLRNDTTDYLKFQLARGKSFSSIVKNRLARTKKVCQLPGANYSQKCLRSQDTYLRNGKLRQPKSDYAKWSMKKLQTRKLIGVVNKRVKKVPAVLKLAESIKHYCDTCNVSFINKELFRLHTCYFD